MYKNKRILAIIPARAGSKGLPGKNILSFCGRPLISWTISQALESKYLDKILVSTDDEKIAAISIKYRACVSFLRPKRLATSTSNMIDVILHVLSFLGKKNEDYDLVVLLQPTSPLRKTEDIDNAIELFFRKRAFSVISICRNEHHPWWSVSLGKKLRIKKFLGVANLHKNRQALPDFYRINGAVYLTKVSILKKNRTFIGRNTYAYIMPEDRSVDIDSRLDFEFAAFIKANQSKK
ncbi:MAG: acylneuraminate cytidylyltransferase family protein [Candidatus Omnitrophica bacterium]|nr:acylneuraminate cytidylyltransferase family protein [Candidatus Omnitrophota bacterium]